MKKSYVSLIGLIFLGMTACSENLNAELIYASGRGDIILIRKLVMDGANINAHELDDLTPLINAIDKNQFEAVRVLLELGADPNYPSGDLVPLFFAFYKKRDEISDMLIRHGAKLIVPDPVKKRFQEVVCSKSNSAKYLTTLARAGYICSSN